MLAGRLQGFKLACGERKEGGRHGAFKSHRRLGKGLGLV